MRYSNKKRMQPALKVINLIDPDFTGFGNTPLEIENGCIGLENIYTKSSFHVTPKVE